MARVAGRHPHSFRARWTRTGRGGPGEANRRSGQVRIWCRARYTAGTHDKCGFQEGEGHSVLARPPEVCQGLLLWVDWGARCPWPPRTWPSPDALALSRVRSHENSWTRPPARGHLAGPLVPQRSIKHPLPIYAPIPPSSLSPMVFIIYFPLHTLGTQDPSFLPHPPAYPRGLAGDQQRQCIYIQSL